MTWTTTHQQGTRAGTVIVLASGQADDPDVRRDEGLTERSDGYQAPMTQEQDSQGQVRQSEAKDGPRVLLVDDAAAIRNALRGVLEDAGIEVVGEALDGVQGVAMVGSLRPDVVLMDLRMPSSNGFQATEQIVQEHRPSAWSSSRPTRPRSRPKRSRPPAPSPSSPSTAAPTAFATWWSRHGSPAAAPQPDLSPDPCGGSSLPHGPPRAPVPTHGMPSVGAAPPDGARLHPTRRTRLHPTSPPDPRAHLHSTPGGRASPDPADPGPPVGERSRLGGRVRWAVHSPAGPAAGWPG